jgi:hypothetical protein
MERETLKHTPHPNLTPPPPPPPPPQTLCQVKHILTCHKTRPFYEQLRDFHMLLYLANRLTGVCLCLCLCLCWRLYQFRCLHFSLRSLLEAKVRVCVRVDVHGRVRVWMPACVYGVWSASMYVCMYV